MAPERCAISAGFVHAPCSERVETRYRNGRSPSTILCMTVILGGAGSGFLFLAALLSAADRSHLAAFSTLAKTTRGKLIGIFDYLMYSQQIDPGIRHTANTSFATSLLARGHSTGDALDPCIFIVIYDKIAAPAVHAFGVQNMPSTP